MTAAPNQNFTTFQGDAVAPVFTVRDPDGNVVNISAVSEITWTVKRFPDQAIVLTKTKTGGQIAFVTTGIDGKFVVAVAPGDTAGMAGVYLHEATITDLPAGPTTVATGQMTVGLRPSLSPSPYDLATLDAVKQYLAISSEQVASDAKLQAMITACSRFILSYLSRGSILPQTLTERRDGFGNSRMLMRQWPVQSISALMIGTTSIPAGVLPSPSNQTVTNGWLLEPAELNPPGSQQALDLFGYCFWNGRQNVQVTYVAGYMISQEAWTIPATPFVITPRQPQGPWGSDWTVTINGVAATKVTGTPATGQYAVSSVGNYTFAAADAGKAVTISYGFIPTDIALACIETVAEKYQYSDRIGILSKSLGGQETVSFSVKDLSDTVKLQLQNYKNVVPM